MRASRVIGDSTKSESLLIFTLCRGKFPQFDICTNSAGRELDVCVLSHGIAAGEDKVDNDEVASYHRVKLSAGKEFERCPCGRLGVGTT